MVSDKIAHTYIIFHKLPEPDSTRSFDFCNWDPISSETIAPADLTFLKVPDTDSSHVLSILICDHVLETITLVDSYSNPILRMRSFVILIEILSLQRRSCLQPNISQIDRTRFLA